MSTVMVLVAHTEETWRKLNLHLRQIGIKWDCVNQNIPKWHSPKMGVCFQPNGKILQTAHPDADCYSHLLKLPIAKDDIPKGLEVAGHAVEIFSGSEITDSKAKVGCTTVTYEEVCALKKAMEDTKC